MLQNFRDNLNGVAKGVLIAIIIIPFALFGVDALFISGSATEEAANVNGETITEFRLQQAVENQKQQFLSRYKNIDPALLTDEQLRAPVIQQLIRKKVVEQTAIDQGMGVSSRTIYDILLDVPEFLTDGKFDTDRYNFALRQMGFTPTSYSKLLSSELLFNQFLQGVAVTGFSTEQELTLLAGMTEQTRDFYYMTLPVAPLLDSAVVSEEDINTYYTSHSDQFMTEEQLVVEYIELQPSDLAGEVSVDDEMVEEAYQVRVAEATSKQSRHVAHILLEKQDDGSHMSKIATIQEKLKGGGGFAALAQEFSEDYITAEQGGDLGFTQTGDLPDALELALDKLSVGDLSDVVESDAGVHILKFIAEKVADVPSRDVLEPSIRAELELQLAQELMPERIETLKDLSYNASSLQDTADQAALDLKVSTPFGRAGGVGVVANSQVINAAFSDTVLEEGYASEVLELSENHLLVLALRERIAPRLKLLEEVKPQIALVIKEQNAREQLLVRGAELQQRVSAGETIEDVAKAENLEWQVSLDTKRIGGNLDKNIHQHVFSMQIPDQTPVIDNLIVANGDLVLISLVKAKPGDFNALGAQQKRAMAASVATTTASQAYQAYEELLLQSSDVASKY
ncbi:MAG: SurA N-terminal domain-containing protein [Porticoccus sp.]